MTFLSWRFYFFSKNYGFDAVLKVIFCGIILGVQDFLTPLTSSSLSASLLALSFIVLLNDPLTEIKNDLISEKIDFFLSEGLSLLGYSVYKLLQTFLYVLAPLTILSFLFFSLKLPFLTSFYFSLWILFSHLGTLSLLLTLKTLSAKGESFSKGISFCLFPLVLPLFVLCHAMIEQPTPLFFWYQFFLVFGQIFCMLGVVPLILKSTLKGEL